MNPSETSFLVLGLVMGTAAGAALWQVVRSRPAPRREVRLTIAPNSIPARRATTLATPGGSRDAGPLPGSPDEDASTAELLPSPALARGATPVRPEGGPGVRTPVLNPAPAIPVNAVAIPIVAAQAGQTVGRGGRPMAATMPVMQASARNRAPTVSAPLPRRSLSVATLEAWPAVAQAPLASGRRAPDRAEGPPAGGAAEPAPAGPCADEQRLVTERCAVADAAREEARRAADALREAHRAYDALRERVERAQDVADPRRVADAKAHLHGAFRSANDAAAGPDEAEAAAREWLEAINRLNASVREASRLAEIGGAELRAQLPALDRLGLEAEAARIGADNAADACQAARERLAACEEAATRATMAPPPEPEEEHPFAKVWPADEPALASPQPPGEIAGVSSIIRVLRGDRDARERIVAALAGTDADAQREWHLRLAHLVDAITARAIEDGYLDLPSDDPFWHLFDAGEVRDVVRALSALGFRYDGMGGFADGRVPATRDLSLAVGYAGLDRMRIRTWPREDAMTGLYASATVAADEWLATQAGDLTLGRMVDALGSRAAALADTWNAWGRVRPILLAE